MYFQKRHRMLKSPKDLQNLDEDSTDIYQKGAIDRYASRPHILKDLCLADFIAWYTFNGKGEMDGADTEDKCRTDGGVLKKRREQKVLRFCNFNRFTHTADFFRERVMLFYPWRNEESEVENANCETICAEHSDLIDNNSKKYIKLSEDISDIIKELEARRIAEELDTIDEEEGDQMINVYDYDDNVIYPDLNIDLNDCTTKAAGENKRYKMPDQLDVEAYLDLCNSLNEKQRDYLMHIINQFKSNSLPVYHFISGGAGVGKSKLIQAVYQSLLRVFRSTTGPVEDCPEVLIVAYTGKAAHNVGGVTAHSAFSLTIGQSINDMKDLGPEALNTLRNRLRKCRLFIVDEISMLGIRTFSQINRRLCQIFGTNKPFGGLSCLVLGDFQQLKPVMEGYVFSVPTTGAKALAGNPLWSLFQLFELDEIMRQKDDLRFAQSLTRFAKGELTDEDVALFESRCFSNDNDLPIEAKDTIRLIWTNKDVDTYNTKRLEELNQKFPSNMTIVVHAVDKVARGDYTDAQTKRALEKAKELPAQKTHGLPTVLKLQVGGRYMVTTNVDVADGLFNGATGILKKIEIKGNKSFTVFIQFDGTIGRKARAAQRNIGEDIDLSWTPLTKQKEQFTTSNKVIVVREQYPLVPAEAITINKSQGQSLQMATIQLDPRMNRSLLYVALSRVTNINGVYLIGKFIPPSPPSEKHTPTLEMKRMRQEAQLIPRYQYLRQVPDGVIQIVSHNVQSLRAHAKTLEKDPVYVTSSLLFLQETWLHENEEVSIQGRVEIARSSITGKVRGSGTIIFSNMTLQPTKLTSVEYKKDNHNFEASTCSIGHITFVNVYISPASTTEFFKDSFNYLFSTINSSDVVLAGDLNDDMIQNDIRLLFLRDEFGLELRSPKKPTTDKATCLDGVFSNCNDFEVQVHIYESYISYHKPLVLRLFRK